jgi:hypothetical protein
VKSDGNGADAPVPVIPTAAYKIRGAERGWDWTVGLPEGLKASDFPVGQIVKAPFSAAREGVERMDKMMLIGADDTFYVEAVAVEPQALGLAVLVREVVKVPAREELPGGALPDNVRVRQAGGDKGIVVERKNKDGSWHEVGSEKNHPDWRGRPDKARDHAKQYARTIA